MLLRLSCWTALLLPLERLLELPEERLEEELLPLERVVVDVPVERELPPPVERDWASISGAMSMEKTSIMEVAKVSNLLIAS